MDIGIQSNLWGPDYHREKMPQMLHEIAQAGYAGIEIGAHRFEDLDHPNDFLSQVQDAGIHVSGIHTLVKFYDSGNLDYARKSAEFTKALGSQFMMVSGEAKAGKTTEDYKSLANTLNQVGQICQEFDLTYCYHNHWYEIENRQAELRALCELTDPGLVSLCMDIGWVERAGYSPAEVSTAFLDRIRYFHLKDTLTDKFVDLGEGTVDFPAWHAAIAGKGDFYYTHERDEVLPNAFESAQHSRQYLRTIGL
ncbi:MAG: sugar phosphate isomerase/epimerase family protein [Anaerolineales bacterium]